MGAEVGNRKNFQTYCNIATTFNFHKFFFKAVLKMN